MKSIVTSVMLYRSYISFLLLVLGGLLFAIGSWFIYYEGVRIHYDHTLVSIHSYDFVLEWPGNYTVSASIPLEMVRVGLISKPMSYVYNVSIPWSSCNGGNLIGFGLQANRWLNVSWDILINVYACDEECEMLFNATLGLIEGEKGVWCMVSRDRGVLECKGEFTVPRGILKYKYFNFTLIPAYGLVIETFSTNTILDCTFSYTLAHPELRVKSIGYQPLILHTPYLDVTGLKKGLISSLTGLLLILLGIYIRIHLVDHKGIYT